MGRTLMRVVLVAALVTLGCSPIQVKLDYDPDSEFNRYKTFDWLDNRPDIPEDVKVAMNQYRLHDPSVRRAVAGELSAKGLSRDEVDPDILVAYHVGVEHKIDVVAWGYRYSGQYGAWGRDIDVYHYREGSLILDLIDAETMHLVWRASAEKTIDKKPAPEQAERSIGQAVSRMFQTYPPVR
jgi:hypothetical protein